MKPHLKPPKNDLSYIMNITGRKMPSKSQFGTPIKAASWVNVWSGTKRSSISELIDEFGETFNFTEFANKIGVKETRPVTGEIFPESVLLTKDFKLITNNADYKCLCLCKTFDVPLWSG